MAEKRFYCVLAILFCLTGCVFVYEKTGRAVSASTYTENKKIVAITFDDGPHYKNTKLLLDGLRERGVKATFFLVGNRIEGNEDLILQMHKDGHLIGNHTFSHANLTGIPEKELMSEITRTNVIIEGITGAKVKYLRPPCGYWNEKLQEKIDMNPVFWTVDPKDWQATNVTQVVNSVMLDVESGDIILFHDIYNSSVVAALEVIDRLLDMGYEFVTVDEILSK